MKLQNVTEEYGIYGMLFSLSNRIQTIGDRNFKDITLKQQFLMIALEMFEQPPTLKEMGELIGCSYQNVKRMAEHLKKERYIDILQDKSDRRKLLLVSTGKIEKMAEESREATAKFMENLYREIPREDLEITLKTLKKMDQNIGGIIE
jgi:DNA-binding MarR family transcriptional regulator